MKINKIYSALILFTLIVAACSPAKQLSSNLPQVKMDKASIVFIVFKIVDDTLQQKRTIELVKTMEEPGKIKSNADLMHSYENYLDVDFYEDTSLVKSIRVEHPLFKRMEYVKDDNSLTSVQSHLSNAEFFLRVQLLQSHNYNIKIFETIGKKVGTLIVTIPILTKSS